MRRLLWTIPAVAALTALAACTSGPDGGMRSTLGHTIVGKPKPELVAPIDDLERCAGFYRLMAAESGDPSQSSLHASQAELLSTAAELARLKTREDGWDGVPWHRERLAKELAEQRADGTADAWLAGTSAECETVLAKAGAAE